MPQAIAGIYENGIVKPLEKIDISTDKVEVIVIFPDRIKESKEKRLKKFPVGNLGKVNEKLITREAIYDEYLSNRL